MTSIGDGRKRRYNSNQANELSEHKFSKSQSLMIGSMLNLRLCASAWQEDERPKHITAMILPAINSLPRTKMQLLRLEPPLSQGIYTAS